MKFLQCFLLMLTVCLLGCHPKPNVRDQGNPSSIPPSSETMKKDSTNGTNAMGGKETCLGPKTVRGKLYHTKGRLGAVGDYILSGNFLSGEGSSYNWKPEYEALVGKEVEVQGVHYRYRCGPIEQCLEGGVIDYLREIASLKGI